MNIKLATNKFVHSKVTRIVISVTCLGLLIYGFQQTIPLANNAAEDYQEYTQECSVHLQRIENAGTIKVAKQELIKAVGWLTTNYATNSFEYKALKANLNYLEQQPENSVLPAEIEKSIQKNAQVIEYKQLEAESDGNSGLYFMIFLVVIGPPAILLALLIMKMEFSTFDDY